MSEKKLVDSIRILKIICLILLIVVVGELLLITNYTVIINNKDETIQTKDNQIWTLTYQISSLDSEIGNLQTQIKSWHHNVWHWSSSANSNETITIGDFSIAAQVYLWRINFDYSGTAIIPVYPDGSSRMAQITIYRWVPSNGIYERRVVTVIDFTDECSSVCLDLTGEFHLDIQPYGSFQNLTVSIDEYL